MMEEEEKKAIIVKDHFDPNKTWEVSQEEIDAQAKRWDDIMKQAERAGLIAGGSGGVIILMHPRTQIDEGCYHKIQWMTGNKHRCK